MRRGKLIGLGVGPGDPDLLTVKAVRILQGAQVVAFVAAAGRASRARETAGAQLRPGTRELVAVLPAGADAAAASRAYGQLATGIVGELGQGNDVVFLCEGDPLLHGTFATLLERLGSRFESVAVPGVTGFAAAAAASLWPLALREQALAVVPASLPPRRLEAILRDVDRAVLVRVGRHLGKVRQVLATCRMAAGALLVEGPGEAGARARPLKDVALEAAGPTALVLAAREPAGAERGG
jgi:precorrin-2/cobalt-factor-2 C20-methyltransferase